LFGLGLGLVVFFWWQAHQADRRNHQTLAWSRSVLDSLSRTVTFAPPPEGPEGRDSLYWQWVAVTAQIQSRRWQQAVRYWASRQATILDERDIAELKQEGLVNPVGQIRDSLMAHPGLIPFKPKLGGTMRFVSGEPSPGIVLLERPHVFAYFEDGHVSGHMLLEYRVLPGPRIRWRVLWTALD
jgi:hypothetical protein